MHVLVAIGLNAKTIFFPFNVRARRFPFIERARTLAVKAHRAARHTHGTSSPRINGSRVARSAREKRYLTSRRDAYFLGYGSSMRLAYTDDNAPSLKTLARSLASRNVHGDV